MAALVSNDDPDKPNLVLTYLDIKGYAEPIRLTLAIGQIPFIDRRVAYDEVKRMRNAGELPFGQVPVLDIDGVRHSQSRALLRWAGTKCGLYPIHSQQLQLHIDAVLDTITDIQTSLTPAWYHHACGRSPISGDLFSATKLSAEQVTGVFEALNDDILPARFQQLERVLQEGAKESFTDRLGVGEGPYFCGNVLTIADVNAYVLISGMLDGTYLEGLDTAGVVSGCDRLLAVVAAVGALPQVRAWETRAEATAAALKGMDK